jgi:hypothetical protein
MSIYVEILVRAPLDALWEYTQTPERHERWDLRFSRITYLPKAHDADPQRFHYCTRLGFGFEVSGEGESTGQRDLADGSRSSALSFRSDHPLSIIREGSGYWRYVPTTDGIRFLTWYDYRTRFGAAGALWDRWIFRPLIGWATAWSFDRLRLWLERGIEPAQTLRQALVHGVARIALAGIFAYQGVVPKILTTDPDELALLHDAGIGGALAPIALTALGALELLFAAVLLIAWHRRWPLWVCLGAMVLATAEVAFNSPHFLTTAFNPVALNGAVASLAAIDALVVAGLPSSAACRRTRPEKS